MIAARDALNLSHRASKCDGGSKNEGGAVYAENIRNRHLAECGAEKASFLLLLVRILVVDTAPPICDFTVSANTAPSTPLIVMTKTPYKIVNLDSIRPAN